MIIYEALHLFKNNIKEQEAVTPSTVGYLFSFGKIDAGSYPIKQHMGHIADILPADSIQSPLSLLFRSKAGGEKQNRGTAMIS